MAFNTLEHWIEDVSHHRARNGIGRSAARRPRLAWCDPVGRADCAASRDGSLDINNWSEARDYALYALHKPSPIGASLNPRVRFDASGRWGLHQWHAATRRFQPSCEDRAARHTTEGSCDREEAICLTSGSFRLAS